MLCSVSTCSPISPYTSIRSEAGSAAPAAANLIQVSGGCGPAFHRNPWGYCVANFGYGYGYYRPYFHWGWGYHPYWHHWHW